MVALLCNKGNLTSPSIWGILSICLASLVGLSARLLAPNHSKDLAKVPYDQLDREPSVKDHLYM